MKRRMKNTWMNLLFLVVSTSASVACHRVSLYELPPPPPEQMQGDVSLVPGEDQRRDEQRYLEARAAAIQIYNLLTTKRYQEVVPLLSAETRDFLRGGGDPSVVEVLTTGERPGPDGQPTTFDPVATLIAEDVSTMSDSVEGMEEHETDDRREIFATLPSGKIQKIVMIRERGQWVLHRTRIPEPFDPPQ